MIKHFKNLQRTSFTTKLLAAALVSREYCHTISARTAVKSSIRDIQTTNVSIGIYPSQFTSYTIHEMLFKFS